MNKRLSKLHELLDAIKRGEVHCSAEEEERVWAEVRRLLAERGEADQASLREKTQRPERSRSQRERDLRYDWNGLNEYKPWDPILVAPLNLAGAKSRVRHQAEAVAEAISPALRARLSDARCANSYWLLFRMLPELTEALTDREISIRDRAAHAAQGLIAMSVANCVEREILLDFGEVAGPEPRSALGQVLEGYFRRILAGFASRGFIHDWSADG